MKRIRPLISGLVACGIAVAMVSSLAAQEAQQGMAKVVSIKGSARYMVGANASWQPLHVGSVLKAGTILQTASGSYVDLVLNNPNAAGMALSAMTAAAPGAGGSSIAYRPRVRQDAVRVFENTVLGVDKLMLDQTGVETMSDTQFDLKAGSIFFSVKKLSTGSKFEVKIPNGVAGVRGTQARVFAIGRAQVFEGVVVLVTIGKDGSVKTKVINAGHDYDSNTGEETTILPQVMEDYSRLLRELPTGQMALMHFARDYTFIEVSATQGSGFTFLF